MVRMRSLQKGLGIMGLWTGSSRPSIICHWNNAGHGAQDVGARRSAPQEIGFGDRFDAPQ